MTESPIQFDHIAVGLERIEDATDFLVGTLGGRRTIGGPAGEFTFWQWRYRNGGTLEVLEPLGPEGGFMHRFLAARGPGIHHVTFKVEDLDEACRRAEELGYGIVGYDASDPSWKEAFLHPKQAQGIVVQFAESPEGSEEARGTPPAQPEPAAEPAAIVGLRLAARDEAAARRQWGELIGGIEERDGDMLRFRWRGSPMTIAVAPGAGSDGPLGIEVAAPSSVELPAGAHDRIGCAFLRVDGGAPGDGRATP